MPLRSVRDGLSMGRVKLSFLTLEALEETLAAEVGLCTVFCADKKSGTTNKIKTNGWTFPIAVSYPNLPAKTPYTELLSARANFSKTDPVLLLAHFGGRLSNR